MKTTPGRPPLDTAYHSSYEGVSYLGEPYPDDQDDAPEEPFRTFCDVKDSVALEDESGRVELEGMFDMDAIATGVVVAVEGVVGSAGVMNVTKLHFASQAPQMDYDNQINNNEEDATVMIVSGLDCGGPSAETSLKRELLVDFLTGHFASEEGSNVARVLVAGGGCAKPIKPDHPSPFGNWGGGSHAKNDVDRSNTTLPIRELDLFLGELVAGGVPVDYIPGLHDPTNANWPQKPMHPCLLPNAGCFVNMLSRSTNPYKAQIGGRSFLGSDGLNVMDLRRFIAKKCTTGNEDEVDDEGNVIEQQTELKEMSPLETLEAILKFQHLAPTGPDSLPTFPFVDIDPFVIEETPHFLFSGNCDEFETKMLESNGVKTRLVCIPSFAKTGQAVKLNLKTMSCTVIEFAGLQRNVDSDQDCIMDEKKMGE